MQTHPTTYLLDYLPNALGGNVSIPHLVMKFPNSEGNIVTIKAYHKEGRECYANSLLVKPYNLVSDKPAKIANIKNIEDLQPIDWFDFDQKSDEEDRRPTPIEQLNFFSTQKRISPMHEDWERNG